MRGVAKNVDNNATQERGGKATYEIYLDMPQLVSINTGGFIFQV